MSTIFFLFLFLFPGCEACYYESLEFQGHHQGKSHWSYFFGYIHDFIALDSIFAPYMQVGNVEIGSWVLSWGKKTPHPCYQCPWNDDLLCCYALVGGSWLSDTWEMWVCYKFWSRLQPQDFKTSRPRFQCTSGWNGLKAPWRNQWICPVSWSRPVIMRKTPPRLKETDGCFKTRSLCATTSQYGL